MDTKLIDYLTTRAEGGFISLKDELRACSDLNLSFKEVEEAVFKLGLMPARYKRNYKTFSVEDQYRLFKSAVAVVGCGGLGGYLIEGLARLGVGTIKAIDPDVFEEHNLNRQLLSNLDNLGTSKAMAALQRLSSINPATRLIPINAAFSKDSADEILSDVQVVADALDSIHTRLVLIEECKRHGIPLVHGSIGGWYGQVSVQYPEDHTLKDLFEGRGDKGIEAELGNPSFTPAMIASIEAAEVCKVLLGITSPLRGNLLVIDLREMNFVWLKT
jgi:molybdopterin/thiamine biosynthesis adenylyltransferase